MHMGHPHWVPFADYIMGNAWLIDQCPGPHRGAIGTWDKVWGGRFPTWPTLAAMLADTSDALEHQRPLDHKLPTIEEPPTDPHRSGRRHLEFHATEPPLDLDTWDEVVDVSFHCLVR